MVVQPIGEAVFSHNGQEFRIAASSLRSHDLNRCGSELTKDDDKDWSVSFSADHAAGKFTWIVYFSVGMSGTKMDSEELLSCPAGFENTRCMTFQLV